MELKVGFYEIPWLYIVIKKKLVGEFPTLQQKTNLR